jgi:hypothetical protein
MALEDNITVGSAEAAAAGSSYSGARAMVTG